MELLNVEPVSRVEGNAVLKVASDRGCLCCQLGSLGHRLRQAGCLLAVPLGSTPVDRG